MANTLPRAIYVTGDTLKDEDLSWGLRDGMAVGSEVIGADGDMIGEEVGDREGEDVGDPVSGPMGDAVGGDVGDTVGRDVGRGASISTEMI